jgi:NitT/TauT family transport system substrate-binding protein
MNRTTRRPLTALLLVLLLALLAAACGDDGDTSTGSSTPAGDADTSAGAGSDEPVTLQLGYFPNVTHAPGIVGDLHGDFAEALGDDVTIETSTYNAGPEAIEALLAEALDITFIGPNPAINAFAQSDGEAIRIIGGATSGGAYLVTRPEITSAEDLEGTSIASPQLGNTQDVALRAWLKEEGLSSDTSGGGDVSIVPQANADTLTAFIAGDIDGAWVPEPWATRLIQEGGGKVLVDEADLWPNGEYVTTHVIVRTEFLEDHPDVVKDFLSGLNAAITFVNDNPEEAKTITNEGIGEITGKPLKQEVIDAAWDNLTFTIDPIASSLAKSAEDATAVGVLDPVELDGIYDLSFLNEILTAAGEEEVKGL